MTEQSANKRLAKNTMLLYVRMILLMVVSLYTSRVVLAALGFDDYGIYNVVGGAVSMFAFINLALGNASSRFITVALGKGDKDHLVKVFNAAFWIHFGVAILIVVLCETIGLWFLYHKMVIPPDRFNAAFWVFQFSVIASVASIICVPFNATIIAHERMGAFAYISLIDAGLKLAIAYLITVVPTDKLILYGALYLFVNLLDILIYQIYCIRHFDEVKFRKLQDALIVKEISKFAGWALLGNLAYVGYTQGLNILLNIFFGPVLNAARGIAVQIQTAVKGFVTNFQTAVNPQITKAYAKDDSNRMQFLIFGSSKISFYMMLCIVVPLSVEAPVILKIWLDRVPEYTSQFLVLTLCIMLIDTLANPLIIANNATGNIKRYQVVQGGLLLLYIPIAYVVLKCGGNPTSVFWVELIMFYATHFVRVWIICPKIGISILTYIKKIIVPTTLVAITSASVPVTILLALPNTLISFLIIVIISIIGVLICSYTIGLNKTERIMIRGKAVALLGKIKAALPSIH